VYKKIYIKKKKDKQMPTNIGTVEKVLSDLKENNTGC
jgi:hypothetical protein